MDYLANLIPSWLFRKCDDTRLRVREITLEGGYRFPFQPEDHQSTLASKRQNVHNPSPGDSLEGYYIIEKVRDTFSGPLYLAHDTQTKQNCMVKVISNRSIEIFNRERERIREASILLKCKDIPAIETIADFIKLPSFVVLVTIAESHRSVRELMKSKGLLSEKQITMAARDLVRALSFLHHKGITHLNITMDSVLISPDGRATLTDFCLANFESQRSSTKNLMYTPLKRSPSRHGLPWASNSFDYQGYKKDMHMLGALLYQMFHGYTPRKLTVQDQLEMDSDCTTQRGRFGMSFLFEDFLHCLMCDEDRRSAQDITMHKWLQS